MEYVLSFAARMAIALLVPSIKSDRIGAVQFNLVSFKQRYTFLHQCTHIIAHVVDYVEGVTMAKIGVIRLVVAVVTVFALCGSAKAGLQEAEDAASRGDDATEYRERLALAQKGDANSQYIVGYMHEYGVPVPKDVQQAAQWYRKAADQGFTKAQNRLGVLYGTGKGIPKDEQQAVKWYRKAADQGDDSAQANLGLMYANGRGVSKDEQQAVLWYRKSADQGNAFSQNYLGLMYGNGQGVPKDEQQAYFWFLLSSAQGLDRAKIHRDLVEAKLTVGQRASAQADASSWKPKVRGQAASGGSLGAIAEERRPPLAATSPIGPESTGSGWAVSSTQIVTNAHVVAGCSRVAVSGRTAARVQLIDSKSDLALLAVPSNPSVALLRTGRLRQGDAVTIVGYPLRGVLASSANVTTGNVSALAGIQNDSRFIQISAPVQPGNSGGPLLDSSGNVVGVVVSKLDAVKFAQLTGDIPQNVNFAVSLFTLQGFLEANAVDYRTAPSTKNLSTADVAEVGKVFTVLVECYK